MNVHDSEKVVGTLLAKGYSQVATPEEANLVLYNTCSIRDKAEQKVFTRLQQFKRDAGKGKFAQNCAYKSLRQPSLRISPTPLRVCARSCCKSFVSARDGGRG